MPTPSNFDWRKPDYIAVMDGRVEFLKRIRAEPDVLPDLRNYYRDNPADFINDWGMTYDPRNVERGLPAVIPFILFPKQKDFCEYVVRKWRGQEPGLAEKTRDMGMSWLAVSLACTLCLLHDGMAIGFGSRKQEYVDQLGAPKSLFFKARMFMENLPVEFRGGYRGDKDAPHMRINFPHAGSNMSGESGDNIGRGDRTGIYFVDEAAYLERPELIDAALSQTTNCRIDISSANGMANPFAQKRFSNKVEVFSFHWRDDPRKDDAWYAKQVSELDPVVVAQEIDIDYAASTTGGLIPSAWVQAAIDAHIKLGFHPSGQRMASLDVADEGKDKNAMCGAHGVVIEVLTEWTGKGSDIGYTTDKAFGLCDDHGYQILRYDADGLGAGVRGFARINNEARRATGRQQVTVEAFRGSDGVYRPDSEDVKGRKNKDYFGNAKAQAWWALRTRFEKTWQAVVNGMKYDFDDMISIPSTLPLRQRLVMELSQPTYQLNNAGKVIVDKTPEGMLSPNLGDAVMIRFSVVRRPLVISAEAVRAIQSYTGPRA